ncbi:MAG TPA: DUF4112 domain-containing protein [Nitrospiraceae bacterium]|nr:DUF4112 domain-containing protein [Nitrospiraceae bacterium]
MQAPLEFRSIDGPPLPAMVSAKQGATVHMARQNYLAVARLLAQVLDRSIRVPGTNLRIGLDPLIGLIPGFGDAVASLAGSMILFLAAQLQVPKIVLVRMSVNIALNGVIGSIPLFGDLFSLWFQSNVRNVALLERHVAATGRSSTLWDWAFVVGLFAGLIGLFVGAVAGVMWLVHTIRYAT